MRPSQLVGWNVLLGFGGAGETGSTGCMIGENVGLFMGSRVGKRIGFGVGGTVNTCLTDVG